MINAPAGPSLLSAAEQAALSQKHRALEVSISTFKPGDAIESLWQAVRYFEDVSRASRQLMVAQDALRTKEELQAGEWVAQRYQHLLAMAQATVVRGFSGAYEGKAGPALAIALVMLLSGHLVKWRKYAGGRADPIAREWHYRVYAVALTNQLESSVLSIRIEGDVHESTIEALSVRAMLLDRFSGGNLSPRRFEVLDTWLVAWMGALWMSRSAPENEPALAVTLGDPARGMAPFAGAAHERADCFLSLRPLRRQLDRTIASFHVGQIFPGWGIGMTMKIEDHVAVIEFLEREFVLIDQYRSRMAAQEKVRGKRINISVNTIVAVYFGFGEICAQAFRADRAHTLIGGGAEIGIRNAIRLVDISEGGLGLEMVDEDARRIKVNDLVAVRLEKGKPCVLGMVARKSTLQRPTGTLVGVKVLSRTPLKLTMDRVNDANQWQACEGLLVPGIDAAGFADAVILSDKDYTANMLVAATLAGRVHEFYARRVREQGSDWRMAALDAIDRMAS
jgi:hypothetical protein